MTRKNFFKGLLALFPFTAQAAKKTNIWETPQGKYVLLLREELKRLGIWDDLPEDWQEVEDALTKGHIHFMPRYSRIVKENGDETLLASIQPIVWKLESHSISTGKYMTLSPICLNPSRFSGLRH
jgi:hypothetical protein